FGATDCALPMVWALRKRMEIDHFCVYTDNETWAGTIHPHQALAEYRRKTGIPARLSVVGMTATDFTIADPEDPGTLDVAGFDSAVPSLLAGFAPRRHLADGHPRAAGQGAPPGIDGLIEQAVRHRAQRDRLVRQLRADDPLAEPGRADRIPARPPGAA